VNPARSGSPAPLDDDVVPALAKGQYDSFVVRVFSGSRADGAFHGQVTHVGTRRSQLFSDLQLIVAFIAAHMNQRSAAGTTAEGTVPPD
jgi:hypothetical protein